MGSSRLDRTLFVALALIIFSGIAALFYSVGVPMTAERFTEFYLLGNEGQADNYPTELMTGDEATVKVGIINREQETASYSLEIRINGVQNNTRGPFVLEQDEKWEETISFRPETAGNDQKVEFLLYKSGQSEAYLSLHLWINVVDQGGWDAYLGR
ncbi:MAG: DUF1616 domain-containing protein [Dehalococcoidales bacterium]